MPRKRKEGMHLVALKITSSSDREPPCGYSTSMVHCQGWTVVVRPLPYQVLERECTPEELARKRRKLESKRAGPFRRVPYMLGIGMKRRALPEKEMPEWEEMCAVASAMQNLSLAATAHGVAGELVLCLVTEEGHGALWHANAIHIAPACTETLFCARKHVISWQMARCQGFCHVERLCPWTVSAAWGCLPHLHRCSAWPLCES